MSRMELWMALMAGVSDTWSSTTSGLCLSSAVFTDAWNLQHHAGYDSEERQWGDSVLYSRWKETHWARHIPAYLGQRYSFLTKRFLITRSTWQKPEEKDVALSVKALMKPVLFFCLNRRRMKASWQDSMILWARYTRIPTEIGTEDVRGEQRK